LRARRTAAVALALVLASGLAPAEALYKWIDSAGKVFYSDRPPPKGFQGKVERIERDTPATPIQLAPGAPKSPTFEPPKAPEPPPTDLNTQRKANRERLQANLDAAREKAAAARKALDAGRDPQEGERRVIQQPQDPTKPTTQSTCHPQQGPDGKAFVMCSTAILTPEYFEKVEKLEAALRDAETELGEAEQAYRRGVD
jgi:hypothetical protein